MKIDIFRKESFIYKHYGKEYKITNYDYIMFILDDVSDFNVDIKDMIRIKEQFCFEILSPKIHNSSYDWMKHSENISVHNFLEIFCFLLKPIDFYKMPNKRPKTFFFKPEVFLEVLGPLFILRPKPKV